MGSETDRQIMEAALPYLDHFQVPHDVQDRGYGVLIAGAGMAAHLAGALKAHTILPVIGVPLPGGLSDGMDALLSTVQMPKGVPVATVSVGKAGAINAAVLAAEILALADAALEERLEAYKARGAKL